MAQNNYYVYIMSSHKKVLYIGVTNDLARRVSEHRLGIYEGFSKKYKCKKLVYYEWFSDIKAVIAREKVLKGWLRIKKINLIELNNINWKDLSEEWA
jgi:putative endonuclease